MTETVVHVETIEQWKAALDVWFAQGYEWLLSGQNYQEDYYYNGSRQLTFNMHGDNKITYSGNNIHPKDDYIEYAEFMKEQEKTMAKETYYVTQEQLDLIEELKSDSLPFYNLVYSTTDEMKELAQDIPNELDSKILRYIGGDTSIEFKVKEQLYRLWLIDSNGDKLFFWIYAGRPDWVGAEDEAFTAPLEEIHKWKTPAWEIEEVD